MPLDIELFEIEIIHNVCKTIDKSANYANIKAQ